MGLRCIIGHDYGEPDRTETREDRGDERVVTVREYRECRRCGHQQVISENTEVRPTGDPAPDPEEETPDAPETPEPDAGDTTDQEYEDVTAEEDDGVILEDGDDEGGDAGRDPGEWPDSEEEPEEPADHDGWPDDHREKTAAEDDPGDWPAADAENDHGDWPETDAEDEGYDAEPSSGGPDESVDFEGGLTPGGSGTPTGETSDAVGGVGDRAPDPTIQGGEKPTGVGSPESGIRRSDPGPSPTTQQRPADPDTVFVCPNCEAATPAHESSFRPGDICPECSRGYLTEREDA